jgi:hypothetical protein
MDKVARPVWRDEGSCARAFATRGAPAIPRSESEISNFESEISDLNLETLATRRARLAELAEQVAHIQARHRGGQRAGQRCSSGLPELDALLGGRTTFGFALGAIHELVAEERLMGAPLRTIALLAAAQAAGRHQWIFYIDAAGDFHPPGAAQLDVPLDRLIVVRCRWRNQALWAAEQALRCRGVGATILPLPTLDTTISRRLQLAAEAGGGLGIILQQAGGRRGRRPLQPTFAATRLWIEPCAGADDLRRVRVNGLKLHEGRPAAPIELTLPGGFGRIAPAARSTHKSIQVC